MPLHDNPFIALSYIGGPALLTNCSGLLLLSTSNRLARAVDRSRFLVGALLAPAAVGSRHMERELDLCQRRVVIAGHAMSALYLAVAAFGLATLSSIAGAVLAEYVDGPVVEIAIVCSGIAGLVGFAALVTATVSLAWEARLAVEGLRLETSHALESLKRRPLARAG